MFLAISLRYKCKTQRNDGDVSSNLYLRLCFLLAALWFFSFRPPPLDCDLFLPLAPPPLNLPLPSRFTFPFAPGGLPTWASLWTKTSISYPVCAHKNFSHLAQNRCNKNSNRIKFRETKRPTRQDNVNIELPPTPVDVNITVWNECGFLTSSWECEWQFLLQALANERDNDLSTCLMIYPIPK